MFVTDLENILKKNFKDDLNEENLQELVNIVQGHVWEYLDKLQNGE